MHASRCWRLSSFAHAFPSRAVVTLFVMKAPSDGRGSTGRSVNPLAPDLREHQHAIRADVHGRVCREPVVFAWDRGHVAGRVRVESRTVTPPIGVKVQFPCPHGGKADHEVVTWVTIEICHHNYIIVRPSIPPSAKGHDVVRIIHSNELDVLAGQTARLAAAIQPQPNEVRYNRAMPRNSSRLSQSTGTVSRNHPPSRNSCP